eukprot:11237362-Karenia_brevis.AAC.1
MGKPCSKLGANADPGWSARLQLPQGRGRSRFSDRGQGRNKMINTVEPALPTETKPVSGGMGSGTL